MHKWSHTAEMQLFSSGGFALPSLWKVAQILCQFLRRHFYGLQAVKAHYTGSTQHSEHDLRDLHDPCVQPVKPLAYAGAAVQGVRLQEEVATPGSHCTIWGQSGMQPPLHSPPKANTTVGSTSSGEAEVPLFDSPFLWSSNTGRAMNVAPFDYML